MKTLFGFILFLFKAFWKALSAARHATGNLLFLLLIFIIIIALFSVGGEPEVGNDIALVVNPVGEIVDQKTWIDPVEAVLQDEFDSSHTKETLLFDIIDAIDKAGEDSRIKVLFLDTDKITRVNLSQLQEIGRALKRFKESGKEVIAYGDSYSQHQFYLAAHADMVYLNPMGGVLLHGYGLYNAYVKKALDKLMIKVEVFRVGTYKSAVEPFTKEEMSKEAKEANQEWLNAIWKNYIKEVNSLRVLPPKTIENFVNQMPSLLKDVNGNFAQMALKAGLVDALKSRREVHSALSSLVGKNTDGDFYQIKFMNYLKQTVPKFPKPVKDGRIAVIVGKGPILDGKRREGNIGGDSFSALIRKARLDDEIKAIVLRLDTGGGSAFASEVIREEILRVKQAEKPVVVSMGAVAASGGYWIASAADEIWASPVTLTGSIGIFGLYPNFEQSLDFLGIRIDGVGTTKLSDMAIPGRPTNPHFKKIVQQMVEKGYNQFLDVVSEGRDMSREEVEKIAQGRVWVGEKALMLGLVDQLGTLEEAIESAASLANLKNYSIKYMKRTLSARDQFMQEFFGDVDSEQIATYQDSANIKSPKNQFIRLIQAQLKTLSDLNDPQGLYIRCFECSTPSI